MTVVSSVMKRKRKITIQTTGYDMHKNGLADV